MKENRFTLAVAALILAFFILAAIFYPQLPNVMASHWNAKGQADGTMSRFWGVFLFPLISLVISAILLAVPRIDPLKANIQKFKNYYYGFIVAFLVYFMYIYMLTLVWNLGWKFNFSVTVMPAVGILFIILGVLVGKAKRNFQAGNNEPPPPIQDSSLSERSNPLQIPLACIIESNHSVTTRDFAYALTWGSMASTINNTPRRAIVT